MMRQGLLLGTALLLFTCAGEALQADDLSAHDTLVSRGLVKRGLFYVLPIELELSKGLLSLREVEQRLASLAKKQKRSGKDIEKNKQQIRAYQEQRRQLKEQLSLTHWYIKRRQLRDQINVLSDHINILREDTTVTDQGQRIQEQLGQARQEYVQGVTELRALVEKVKSRYAALKKDRKIQSALAKLNATRKKPMVLGPRRYFSKNVKQLQKYESVVYSQAIPLRSKGNIFWVETLINGKFNKSMIFDTGASHVSLPYDFATAVGLHPSDADPLILLRIADGRTVQGRQMILKSVQVGRFKVDDVSCVVMPQNLEGVPPLLGGAFLRHFTYQIDPLTKQLTLSRFGPPSQDRPSRRARRK